MEKTYLEKMVYYPDDVNKKIKHLKLDKKYMKKAYIWVEHFKYDKENNKILID